MSVWTYNGKVMKTAGGSRYSTAPVPAGLPAKTMRFDFHYDHFDPTTLVSYGGINATWTHVANDVYDFHYDDANWGGRTWPQGGSGGLFNTYGHRQGSSMTYPMTQHEFDIIDSNLSGVTDISELLSSAWRAKDCVFKNTGDVVNAYLAFAHRSRQCYITSLNRVDLHSATNISYMLINCRYLATSLDFVFGSSGVTNCTSAFSGCYLVPGGQVDTYNQLVAQQSIESYSSCFYRCGYNSTTGTEELTHIPTSWGGTMQE